MNDIGEKISTITGGTHMGEKVRPHCITADAVFLFPAGMATARAPRPPRTQDRRVRLVEVTAFTDLLSLRDRWNALLAESDNNGIFLTWEWLTVWWDVFGRDKELCILLGYYGGELIGIAPLMRRRMRIFGMLLRSIELIGSGSEVTPDQLSFITKPSHKAGFIRTVFEYFGRNGSWDLMKLRDMKDECDLIRMARVFSGNGRRFSVSYNGICPYITLPKTWEGYLEGLSSQNRYNIGRKERALARKFSVEFSLVKGPERLPEALGALEALHKKRMREKKMAGASLGESFWEFHGKLAREFLGKGWLMLGMLSADGRIVACQYAFCYDNRAVFYQSGIDPDLGRYSVGMITTAYMIRESIGKGLVEYDFLRGAEEYKAHWARTHRKNTEVLIWNGAPRVLMPYLLFNTRKFLGLVKRRITGVLPGS